MHRSHLSRRHPLVAVICTLCVLGLAAAACSSPPAAAPAGPRSIVQLGDSVASGEGTLYGYTYDTSTQRWTGGNIDAVWPGPYPLCHDSPDAYGHVLATQYRAHFAQFACTGSTFANGITAPRTNAGITYRPAQFGDLTTNTNINTAYDAARPDLVLVTLGADDVQFSPIVRACVINQLAHALDPSTNLQCTAANPGPTVQADALDHLPMLLTNLKTLARWINQRGAADHRVPKVVFTSYFDPFPTGSTSCPDTALLAPTQVRATWSSLLQQLNGDIVRTITPAPPGQRGRGRPCRRPPSTGTLVVLVGPLGLWVVDHQPVQPIQPAVPGPLPPHSPGTTTDRQPGHAGRQPLVRVRLNGPSGRVPSIHGA